MKHEGFELWLKCMDKNEDAWKRMERYNRQDVVLLSRLYLRTLPWIDTHPNRALYRESGTDMLCPNCSSTQLIKKGIEHLKTRSYQRYKCKTCGIPVRESKALPNTSVTLTQSRN